MNWELRGLRHWAVPLAAAALLAWCAPSNARDANELMLKSVGTTENVSPVIVEAIKHAAMDLTPEQRKLALECWKNNVCETGHGNLTVAYADGFRRECLAPGHQDGIYLAGADLSEHQKDHLHLGRRGRHQSDLGYARVHRAEGRRYRDLRRCRTGAVAHRQGGVRGRYPRGLAQRHLCRWQGRQGFRDLDRRRPVCARHRFRENGRGKFQKRFRPRSWNSAARRATD